jgi:glycosyltransferase involved in cell wall biosynthesis
MERSSLGIVVPALNEARTIANVVSLCKIYGVPIVIDDGSSDDTGAVAAAEGAQVVRHSVNKGYDAALNSGFRKAEELGFEYVISIDADGQHNPLLLEKFCELLDAGADIVVGNRNERARLAEHCFAVLTKIMFGLDDPLCGLKGYRMSIYKDLGHFDSYDSIGTELVLFAVRNGFRMEQVPIIVQDRVGTPRFGRRLYANYKIFRAMFLFFFVVRRIRI